MKNYDNYAKFSDKLISSIIRYYLNMEDGVIEPMRLTAEKLGYNVSTIRKFIDSIDKTKDVNDNYSKLYILILSHVEFSKSQKEGSNYMNQQQYFADEKKKKAKRIALYLYEKQQSKKRG